MLQCYHVSAILDIVEKSNDDLLLILATDDETGRDFLSCLDSGTNGLVTSICVLHIALAEWPFFFMGTTWLSSLPLTVTDAAVSTICGGIMSL